MTRAAKLLSATPDSTRAIGRRLAKAIKPGDVVCLSGPLGAGKTTLVQGMADGLGYRGRATSPSFGLAREYRTRRLTLHHLDLFRLGPDELSNVGLEEFLDDPRGACVMEWPGSASALLPEDRLDIRISWAGKDPDSGRRLELAPTGPRSRRLAAQLA